MFTGEAHMTNRNSKSIRATVLPPYGTARKAFAGYGLASYTTHDFPYPATVQAEESPGVGDR